MPVRKVNGGYRWGNSGKLYPTKAQAERQGRAIHASGYANGGIASLGNETAEKPASNGIYDLWKERAWLRPTPEDNKAAIEHTMTTYFEEDSPHVTDYMINQAIVESRLGQDKNTYNIRTSADADGTEMRGGFSIHQMDEIAFEEVKNRLRGGKGVPSGLKSYRNMVEDAFGKDLEAIKYEDLKDPVYSTIFSRLFHMTNASQIPKDLEGQARYWVEHYNKSAIPKVAKEREISVQDVRERVGTDSEIRSAVEGYKKELMKKFIERSGDRASPQLLMARRQTTEMPKDYREGGRVRLI